MKLNAGFVTPHLAETLEFYTEKLGFGIRFQNDWYVLLHTPDGSFELSFLAPGLEHQHPVFRGAFGGVGAYLTLEVDDVDGLHDELVGRGVEPVQGLRDEPWGDRHFTVCDPNGVMLDFVRYTEPAYIRGFNI